MSRIAFDQVNQIKGDTFEQIAPLEDHRLSDPKVPQKGRVYGQVA